ncbi:EpsG family protein [Chryseobacterium sp. SC28]|uniref:EpsG family protein n=1 Tax=Chryseobacterium sp. SC28 TaxID=2268028 RepID=UPI000F651FE0|nr:EpsG family protein [Chryseobacterium sp. SC28]
MVILLFFIFALISIFYIVPPKNKTINNVVTVFLVIILILVAGLRGKNVDSDYYVYYDNWRTINMRDDLEYSFILIKKIIKSYLNLDFTYLLLTYATLGVSTKVIGIKKLSPLFYGSLLIYFSHYFVLHEMTQIRIGVATGFILIAINYLIKKNYYLFLLFMGIAIFFHQTSTIALLIIFFSNSKRNMLSFILLIPLGYVIYFSNSYLNIAVPLPFFQDKIETYKEATESGFLKDSEINVFNALFLLRILVFYTLILFRKEISKQFSAFYYLMKVYSVSLFTFLFLSDVPVFAFRIQELFGVVEIMLFPSLIFIFPTRFRWVGKTTVWFLALVLLLLDIYYNKYILTS